MGKRDLSGGTPFRGIYTEQPPLEEVIRPGEYSLAAKPHLAAGSALLNYYQDTHVPLFLRKKEFAAHLSERMERRVVYCAQTVEEREVTMHGLAGIGTGGDGEFRNFAAGIHQQMENVQNEADEKQKKHDDFWNFMERWEHESIFTNEERYLLGEMSAADYLQKNAGRDLEAATIRHRAWEKQQNLEYQLRKEKHRRMEMQYRQMLEAKTESIERKIRVMETIHAIYYNEKLFALYFPRKKQEIWEIYGSGEVHPFHIAGTIYSMQKLGEAAFDLPGLFAHLAEAYGDALPRLTKPKQKPDGISNEAWELWMKVRILQYPVLF